MPEDDTVHRVVNLLLERLATMTCPHCGLIVGDQRLHDAYKRSETANISAIASYQSSQGRRA